MSTKQILAKTTVQKWQQWTEQQHLDFIIQMYKEQFLHDELSEESMVKLIDWFATLPKEHTMKVFSVFGQGGVSKINVQEFFTRPMPEWCDCPNDSVGEYFADCVSKQEENEGNKFLKEHNVWLKINLGGMTEEEAKLKVYGQ